MSSPARARGTGNRERGTRAGSRSSRGWAVILALLLLPFPVPLSPFPFSLSAQSPPASKLAASITRIFGSGARVDSVQVDTSVVLRLFRSDSLLGFASVRNVIGKDQPITLLVAIDPADQLRDVDVLVYREPYGGEVAYEAWRRQFRGKSVEAPMQVGRDIRSISGATISVHAVTAGVRQALAELTAWHRAGRLQ